MNIKRQIDRVIEYLVEVGLSDDQNFAFSRDLGEGHVEISFFGSQYIFMTLKDRPYIEIYDRLVAERSYTAKMPDGALLQMMYIFKNGIVERHRLAFYPSPHLEEFQNSPDIYMDELAYAEIVAKNVVPFPVRFDFDSRVNVFRELEHPKSHLTLGHYERCRIPVSAPVMPTRFADFVLRNFYHTAFGEYAQRLPRSDAAFEDTIFPTERSVVHVHLPVGRGVVQS